MFLFRVFALFLTASLVALSLPAGAQTLPNCEVTTAIDPDRQVLTCAFGVVIEMEAAAQMGFVAASGDAPAVIELDSGAVLLEVEPGSARPQIRTPHAIAAVRGTTYVVDVTAQTTTVFVLEGEVAVSREGSDPGMVTLEAGDGIDVSADAPLEVSQWPTARAQLVLSRFGR